MARIWFHLPASEAKKEVDRNRGCQLHGSDYVIHFPAWIVDGWRSIKIKVFPGRQRRLKVKWRRRCCTSYLIDFELRAARISYVNVFRSTVMVVRSKEIWSNRAAPLASLEGTDERFASI
jgi:hypothetical protein